MKMLSDMIANMQIEFNALCKSELQQDTEYAPQADFETGSLRTIHYFMQKRT